MALRTDWEAEFPHNNPNSLTAARFICPHCAVASTFQPVAVHAESEGQKMVFYVVLKCNYAPCRKNVYVRTTKDQHDTQQRPSDDLTIFPPRDVAKPHPALPRPIAEDWIEAQRALEVGAAKAAAVMCRRVLYGVPLDKKCKEHPLHEGLQQLAQREKLPSVVENWLNEIKEEGHDAAHPHRALYVSTENVSETMEYTRELLRFVYVEPFELQARLARKAAQAKTV